MSRVPITFSRLSPSDGLQARPGIRCRPGRWYVTPLRVASGDPQRQHYWLSVRQESWRSKIERISAVPVSSAKLRRAEACPRR
jgi:hypothetical protein